MEIKQDVIIIGSGPNGLAAGIYLARKGLSVTILEAGKTAGGGMRTAELTLPGFKHDVCSAIHNMGYMSPYFNELQLNNYGLEWVFPEASVAHPLENNTVALYQSLEKTAEQFGSDAKTYQRLMSQFANREDDLFEDALKPLGIPKNPLLLAKFGIRGLQPASFFAKHKFKNDEAKALFAGCAAHSILPFNKFFTTAVGMMFLISGHKKTWPLAKGGSQSVANALLKCFEEAGGKIELSTKINQWSDLPNAKAYLFDTDPQQLIHIAKDQLPENYKKRLNNYTYGPGVFKIDYALSEAIPWKDKKCIEAGTIHLGGTIEEIAQSEQDAWSGKHSDKPYVLLAQQSLFDDTRAPKGRHTCWAYCHVPFGSEKDMSSIIENQIEHYAPGFKDIILAKSSMNTKDFYNYNSNYLGGVIAGGSADITQLFTRPIVKLDPYSTPNPQIFICSASTPPGGGVHGMGGYYAAKSVFKKLNKS
jgi:phytoene dehydrogenase-like protein